MRLIPDTCTINMNQVRYIIFLLLGEVLEQVSMLMDHQEERRADPDTWDSQQVSNLIKIRCNLRTSLEMMTSNYFKYYRVLRVKVKCVRVMSLAKEKVIYSHPSHLKSKMARHYTDHRVM